MEVVEEGAVPELDGRINPGGLPAQLLEAPAVEGHTVHEDMPGRRSMPAEEDADEARLASA